jgi:flagellar biosynthetic protein FliQ
MVARRPVTCPQFWNVKPMNAEFAVELLKAMIYQALMIAAPILITAMVIGLAISLFQAVTTIHEQTLAFVPKALGVIGILLLLLPWIVRSLVEFATSVIQKMPQMVQ